MRRRRTLHALSVSLVCASILVAALFYLAFPLQLSTPSWLILLVLAGIAETIPVPILGRGMRITFTAPFIAGIVVGVNPFLGLAASVAIALVSSVWHRFRRSRFLGSSGVLMNACNSAISVAVGTGLMLIPRGLLTGALGSEQLAAACFIVGYIASNYSLVTLWEYLATSRSLTEGVLNDLRPQTGMLVIYVLITLSIQSLVAAQLWFWTPLTLIPILVLRSGFIYQAQMNEHYYETITALTLMLQRTHPYTHGHLERVAKIAEQVALRLGLPARKARLVREAAVLHDIGKIAVDERILDKPGKLTEEEFEHIKQHSEWGAQILEPLSEFREMISWIRHHHERMDGAGYPAGLDATRIPLESRIISVVDAYDAMVGGDLPGQTRTYRTPKTPVEAVQELERCSGTQFDGIVVGAFKKVVAQRGTFG